MCTNALNCTHSPLIDGAELLRSTRQILQRVKHGLSDRLNSPERRWSLDFHASFFTHVYWHVNAAWTFKWELHPQPPRSSTWYTVVIVWDFSWHCCLSMCLSLEADVSIPLLCSTREGQIAEGCLALAITAERKVITWTVNITSRTGQPHPESP